MVPSTSLRPRKGYNLADSVEMAFLERDAKERVIWSNMVSGRRGWGRIEGVGSADCMDCIQYIV